jgi:hypothetical protein
MIVVAGHQLPHKPRGLGVHTAEAFQHYVRHRSAPPPAPDELLFAQLSPADPEFHQKAQAIFQRASVVRSIARWYRADGVEMEGISTATLVFGRDGTPGHILSMLHQSTTRVVKSFTYVREFNSIESHPIPSCLTLTLTNIRQYSKAQHST